MSNIRSLSITLLAVLALLSACQPGTGGPAANGAKPGTGKAQPGGKNAAQARPAIPVAVARASIGPIATYYTTTATLEVEKEAIIPSRVSGLIEKIFVEEDDQVTAGQVLLEIETGAYQLRLDQARARRVHLEGKFNRLEALSRDIVSFEDIEAARNELDAAKADEAVAALNVSFTKVEAPFDGRIVRRYVDVGQKASLETQLFGLADFSPLLARVHVPAREFRKLQIDQDVQLTLNSTGVKLAGRVTLISPTIDSGTGTIKVTVEILKYPEGTRPGDFAEVRVVTENRPASTLVPKEAVVSDKGDKVIYVAIDSVAERRVVEVGFTDDEFAEISDGIEAGESIVVKGQRSLKHGQALRILQTEPRAISNKEQPKNSSS